MNPMQKRLERRTVKLLNAFDALAEVAERSDDYTQQDIDRIAAAVLEKSQATFEKLRIGKTELPFKL